MRNLKKVLSLVLCLAMMLSIMVMGAGAAFTDQDKIVNKEAVDMCSALNIINGYEDNSYRPEGNITRAETTKLIAMMLNGGKEGNLPAAGYSSFSDVLTSPNSKWASPYIEYCVADGIVCGWDGMFAPDNNVTATEAAKMLLVSLGYKSDKEGFEGTGWNVRVNVKASQVGLYNGLKGMDVSAPLTRDNAAQMIWNALQANTVLYSPAGQAVSNNQTLLAKAYGATVDTGVMAQIYYNKDTKEYTYSIVDANVDRNDIGNVIGGGDFLNGATTFVTAADYSDLFAMNVTVLHKGNQALLIRVNEGGTVVEGVYGDINFNNTNSNTFTVNGQKYRLDNVVGDMTAITVLYNGIDDDAFDAIVFPQYSFRAIDLDGGGDVDLFVVYPYVVLKVDNVMTNSFVTRELARNDAKLVAVNGQNQNQMRAEPDEIVQDRVMINNLSGAIEFDDVQVSGKLAPYGYVMAVPGTFTAQGEDIYTALNIQSGVVKKLNTNDSMITMNGTQYDGGLLSIWDNQALGREISLNNTYSYVEVNNYLFMMDGAGMVPAYDNYVVVTKTANFAENADQTWQTDLLTTKGTTMRVDVSNVDLQRWFIGGPVVGAMYTYQVNDDGYYELTAVVDGNKQENSSVFDLQQVYKWGATLNDTLHPWLGYINSGVEDMYGTNSAGSWFADEDDADTVYNIEKDAVIFVYNADADPDNGGVEYSVVKGSDLKNLNVNVDTINWAFTGASVKRAGIATVDLGYVLVDETPDEITMYAALTDDNAIRAVNENGKYYISVDVIAAGGKKVTLETPESMMQDKPLFDLLYNALTDAPDSIFQFILDKNGKLIGIKNYGSVGTTAEITGIYNGIITLDDDNTVFVTDNTIFLPTGGMTNGYDDLVIGDEITYDVNNNNELVFVGYNK
ncbi:MAG: S-layer homology domain-containing protein [Evtepia sp.]|uniref:S-layer homology domain-containing protein n=1 Tax=Evtepia sp. TaxID=2773933 RepID=UPI002A75201A|nr:S-layer homology domain-containing protein [Evtepia sp.]MDY3014729.1 S-layer homology domain-containing protein [Evtepia sp.]